MQNREEFDKTLLLFTTSTATSMETARQCADTAILQFEEHGDLSFLQALYEAMPKNFHRPAALVKWFGDHAPLAINEQGTVIEPFKKDKSNQAVAFNTVDALCVAFWEHSPNKEVAFFGTETIVSAMMKALAKFDNADKYEGASEIANLTLVRAKDMVREFGESVKASVREQGLHAQEDATSAASTTLELPPTSDVIPVPAAEQVEQVA